MRDDSVFVAVEDALRRPAFCGCGKPQHLETRDGALWLECEAFDRPTRLPSAIAHLVRNLGHERRHVVDLPPADVEDAAA